MWVCGSNFFISIVEDRNNPSRVLVRARKREHLDEFFEYLEPGSIIETEDADYRWRVYTSKSDVSVRLMRKVNLMDYDNFKKSVQDSELHDAYMRVWGIMKGLQDGKARNTTGDLFETQDHRHELEDRLTQEQGEFPLFY